MSDLLYIVLMIAATYAGGAVFVFTMMRVFFPLKSRREWEKISAQRADANIRRMVSTRRTTLAKS